MEKKDKRDLYSKLEFWRKAGSIGLNIRQATRGDIGRFQVALDILFGEDDILSEMYFEDDDEDWEE